MARPRGKRRTFPNQQSGVNTEERHKERQVQIRFLNLNHLILCDLWGWTFLLIFFYSC